MASRVVLEICLFIVLLVLIGVQVVVYWACDSPTPVDGTSYGLDHALVDFLHEDRYGNDDEYGTKCKIVRERTLTLVQRSWNCYQCSFQTVAVLPMGANYSQNMSTTHPYTFRLLNETGDVLKEFSFHFGESDHWMYSFRWNSTECMWMAQGNLEEAGENAYLPILYAAVVIVALSLTWVLLSFMIRYAREKGYMKLLHLNFMDRLMHRDLGTPISSHSGSIRNYNTLDHNPLLTSSFSDPLAVPGDLPVDKTASMKAKRLVSLDTFRGLSLIVMIFVNYGGGGYWFFDHSIWNGLTVADLVFPWFIWIMGVSLVFSFKGRRKDSLLMQVYQIIRRTVILFAVGLFLSATSDIRLSKLRIPGVLQRFAATYFVVALTEALSSRLYNRKTGYSDEGSTFCSCILSRVRPTRIQDNRMESNILIVSCDLLKDILNNWIQWLVLLTLELLWLLLTFLLHRSNCPRGYLGPGGIAENSSYPNCTGGAAGLIDQWLLGNSHLYDEATAKDLYHLQWNYDPEGVLGTLNSIVLCFLGVQAGKVFVYFKGKHAAIILRLIVWGITLSVIGTLLCLGQKNAGLIPINKNLWSLSFVLLMGGTGYLLLSFFYFTIDATRWWNGSPFRYPGTNSIIVYVGHILLGGYFPFDIYNQERSHLTYLTANLVAVAVWMLIAFYWYSIGFFVKI